jgi:hypothetical protein
MKIASTAAEAAVDAPKINRNSRVQTTWYTRAHKPEPKRRGATFPARVLHGIIGFLQETHPKRRSGNYPSENAFPVWMKKDVSVDSAAI